MKIHSLFEKERARVLAMLIKTRTHGIDRHRAEGSDLERLSDSLPGGGSPSGHRLYLLGSRSYDPRHFGLYWIAVDMDFQGQRVGSKLLNFLEELLKAEGDGKGEYIMGTGRFEGIKGNLSFNDKRITPISPGLDETGSDIIVDGTSAYTLLRK